MEYHALKPEIPQQVINSKKEWTNASESDPLALFQNEYDITNDEKDFVSSSDLKTWLAEKKLGISMEKFSKDLKKYCVVNGKDKVVNKLKKVRGKAQQCWVGVKLFTYIFNPATDTETDDDDDC